MRITRHLLTATLLACAANAVAASSTDLNVHGLITPSACVPEISNGGEADFGKLAAKDLRVDRFTRLDSHYLQMKVTCEAQTFIALQGHDNRAGSAYREEEGNFGLGLINGDERLGSFWVVLTSAIADGVPARFIESIDGGTTWFSGGSLWRDSTASVANTTTLAPIPVKVLSGEMDLRAFIAPTNTLTLTEEVPIDGSVTVTVVYL